MLVADEQQRDARIAAAGAAGSYLAAAERIDVAGERPDVCNDEYDVAAYAPEGLVWIEANGGHLRAADARKMAYELLVLADLSEATTPEDERCA